MSKVIISIFILFYIKKSQINKNKRTSCEILVLIVMSLTHAYGNT